MPYDNIRKWTWAEGDAATHAELHYADTPCGEGDSVLYHGADWPMKAEHKALIAAAPELFAALGTTLGLITKHGLNVSLAATHPEDYERLNAARRMIEKAEDGNNAEARNAPGVWRHVVKHTPGPFRAEVPPSSSGFGRAIYAVREDGPDVFVAYVGDWKQPPAVEVADAALFVAAPIMLEALHVAASRLSEVVAINGGQLNSEALAEVRQAIAKAEG